MTLRMLGALFLILGAAILTSCAMVASPVGNGLIFTKVDGPVAVADNAANDKEGRACASNVLGIVASGDASIETARKNGGITQISTVDHNSFSVLFMYSRFCTIVHGS